MAKHFDCWSETLQRPVTVIKATEKDPLQEDSSATFNDSNNVSESE